MRRSGKRTVTVADDLRLLVATSDKGPPRANARRRLEQRFWDLSKVLRQGQRVGSKTMFTAEQVAAMVDAVEGER